MPSILILGATSDIAVAIAEKFAKEKYDILLAARNAGDLDAIKSDLSIRFDVAVEISEFDAKAFEKHKYFYNALPVKPDVTVCVFGFMADNEEAMKDQDILINTINVNYAGAASILNIIASDYSQNKAGTIVGISSVAGIRGRQSNFIYGSAKAGFTAYLSGLRNKLYSSGAHVVTVLPGFVYTKMTEGLKLPAILTARPEQVANSVYMAVKKKKNVIYVKWFWRWIMLIIKMIPEPIFKKLKL